MRTRLALGFMSLALLAAACGDSDDEVAVDDNDGSLPTTSADDDNATRPVDGEDAYAIADLTITVTHPDIEPVSYQLSCLGDTATILPETDGVSAEGACAALRDEAIVTRLVDGPADDLVCTEQYGGPDEASITGILEGDTVDAVIHRVNGCGIDDWDRLLAAVLPPAIGVTDG